MEARGNFFLVLLRIEHGRPLNKTPLKAFGSL